MGLKLSCLTKKTKKQKPVEYSPRTAQEMDNARRTGKLIYPPLSSIGKQEPKRSVLPNGGLLYKPIHIDSKGDETNHQYHDESYENSSYFGRYNNHYDDGTFAVISRQPMNSYHILRI